MESVEVWRSNAKGLGLRRLVPLRWFYSPRFLNLGGGPHFGTPVCWTNFDAALNQDDPGRFDFSPSAKLPVGDGEIDLIYSSHFLEHLDDPTVGQVLSEARRVLRPGGLLLIKIPDFEAVQSAWRSSDMHFFSDQNWGISSVSHLWQRRGIADSLTQRALMIFSGYWNEAYGDHFSRSVSLSESAYHGPPKLTEEEASEVLSLKSPHEIASRLRQRVLSESVGARIFFNHQNAWSRQEFNELLALTSFQVISTSPTEISRVFRWIPGIDEMFSVSLYLLARKCP